MSTRFIQDKKTGQMVGSVSDAGLRVPSPNPVTPGPATADAGAGSVVPLLFEQLASLTDTPVVSVNLFDVVDEAEYVEAVNAGHIGVQTHPELPYVIHNYTPSCMWENAWNNATLTCRGLVTHAETGVVVARPFRKFFNHEQPGAPVFDLDLPVVVTDKADGSLGLSVPRPDGSVQIATRGSFLSEQAVWASALFAERYAGQFRRNPRWTYLFEIIAPFNRIVVDYGPIEDLILLGAVDNATGRSVSAAEASEGYPGPVIEQYSYRSLREVLSAPARDNAEGFVLWDPVSDDRIKYKYDDYKRLHQYLTNTTPKHVWEVLSAGQDPAVVFADAPDEFHAWLRETSTRLSGEHATRKAEAVRAYDDIVHGLPSGWDRRAFAEAAKSSPFRSALFMLLDGRPIDGLLWDGLKPSGREGALRVVSTAAD